MRSIRESDREFTTKGRIIFLGYFVQVIFIYLFVCFSYRKEKEEKDTVLSMSRIANLQVVSPG